MSELKDKDSEFLKEAIADARTIKEVAVENAKDVLEEAFTTRLQSMISDRIQKEAEEEMGFDMGDEEGSEGEDETDVKGDVEYSLDDEGELEDLELDVSADEEGEKEIEPEPEVGDEEPSPDMGDMEGGEESPEGEGGEESPEGEGGEGEGLDIDVGGEEEGEEQLEDDIDLEEVLRFLEGDSEDYEHEEDEKEDEKTGRKRGEQGTGPEEYVNETERTMRDPDIQEIINELEEDIEEQADVDQQIEEFLDSLDNQVYEVDVNELQEEIDRSSEGSDDVYEIDVDKLEEDYRDLNVDVGTEGHDTGDYYDEDFMDGYDMVDGGETGMHQNPEADNEIYIDLDEPSSSDLGEPQYDEGPSSYDQSGEDAHERVNTGDLSDHGTDASAPDAGEQLNMGEGELSYEDLLQEIGEDLESSSRSEGSSNQEVEALREENEELREKLKKHRQASKILRKRINEVNLINSKLLYTNRLFKRYSLNEDQKLRVIEALDRATDKRSAKLVYSTLAEAFDSNVSRKDGKKKKSLSDDKSSKKNLSEALAKGLSSKNTGSQKPESDETKEKILNEDVEMRSRFQKLADINDRKG